VAENLFNCLYGVNDQQQSKIVYENLEKPIFKEFIKNDKTMVALDPDISMQ
jgi:hypothetical protein